ncbi:MAG: amidohydrolase [Bacteroidetes bacterium]|nr:amidohydrolase [Bacteroidota bacterium]
MSNLKIQIQQLAESYFEEIRSIRRHLHTHPELSFEEYNTAAFIAEKLTEFGIPFTPNIAKTGIVGIISGKEKGKTIALRADMDALPITEANDIDYKSQNAGVMHACGHDVHTACLLGAAKILNTLKDSFNGTIKLIFQPSEERLPGGANEMITAGVLQNPEVDFIFGQHVFTPYKVGTLAFCPGKMMASTDELYITIKGKGGHAAYPHQLIDPVVISAQIITALQQLVSRSTSPTEPSVVSIGKVIANGATNVIPNEVYMEGTLRAMQEDARTMLQEKIKTTIHGIANAMGANAEVEIKIGYPSLINDIDLTERTITNAKEYLGEENVFIAEPRMGAEDFAFYSQKIASCFYRLGTGNPEKGITSNIHTPTFNIDEEALKIGMGFMAFNALKSIEY